jgi:Family of unknown function (DUF6328)
VFDDSRNETPDERADRNMSELLQELRVALPGVQILFAFLLAVPFQQRFEQVSQFQKSTYFATLLLSAVATAFLISPSAYHRLNFRRRDKEYLVEIAGRFMVIGMAALALAMTGAVMFVTDELFRETAVAVTAAAVALMFALLWFVMPLLRRRHTQAPRDRRQAKTGRERPPAARV